jgi:redox-sensitive bicupin YhaK (pirin superfamily)
VTDLGTPSDVTTTVRPLERIVAAQSTLEGGGFEVYRPFPTPAADWFDPFLLLDEMAPNYQEPGEAVGAPPHPHRGFETVTYILRGEVEHTDSAGNHGIIGPGDVQWMTAGDGIVHSEMPSERIQTEGGYGHGLQLWVNLPASLRRTTPNYQALPANTIKTTSGNGWRAEVVAGSLFGVTGPAKTRTPIGYARLTAEPGTTVRIPVADGHTALVYAFSGRAVVGDTDVALEAQHLAVFEQSSGAVVVSVPEDAPQSFDCLLLTGEPIGEPMARYGPFVMNTRAELSEAVEDFNAGRMGSIAATGTV